MKIIAAVQARMGSSRLPNKAMAAIMGKPMAWRTMQRVMLSDAFDPDNTVLSIPTGSENDALRYMAFHEGAQYVSGSEDDLLSRTLLTAQAFAADAVVRITADCPLNDPQVIDAVVSRFSEGGLDYVSNVWPRRTFPAGIAAEAFSLELLERLDALISRDRFREYFNVYLWRYGQARIGSIENQIDLSHLRWTVDYPRDLTFVRQIYARADPSFSTDDVLRILAREPQLVVNSDIPIQPLHGLEGE
jgi:spore coat polysaccharide biosynthesis protein SpsF (cytidylyltransferase family)